MNIENTQSQMRKGILEFCILSIIRRGEAYPSDIVEEMKEIININLSGRVIPFEDTAYESLQRYIESLRRYFANENGRDEIINDIESRISELMNDKIRRGSAAITDEDIEEIIGSMGRIE